MRKRIISMMLVICMVFMYVPITANAMPIYVDLSVTGAINLTLEVESGDSIDNVKRKIKEATGYSETIQKYVLDHHEAADGNGYMHKTLEDLQEGQIELHIADVYEAIQEDRAYRSGRDAMAAYQMVSYMCSSLEEFNALESIWAAHMCYS